VFRDELINLFPEDANARRLCQQTFLLSEFLEKNGKNFSVPQISGKAVVQGHCHQKSLIGMESDARLLSKIGLEAEILDSSCCGMAGSFGFEAGERFEVSMKAGERVLLPAVRAAAADSVIVADGFSCREQIRQATGRQALHSAQVLQMALKRESAQAGHPEHDFVRRRELEHRSARRSAAAVLATGVALAFLCMRKIGKLRAAQ
jgi:Fe-S oxidoreductase